MDGLGGTTGRHISSMVIRFTLDLFYPDLAVGGTLGGALSISAETTPCAMNRHLFWDEQISLSIPQSAMTERVSTASTITIALMQGSRGSDRTFAICKKTLFSFLHHVVDVQGGSLRAKHDRHDSVVALNVCETEIAHTTHSASSRVGAAANTNVASIVRVRLGLMLFQSKPGSLNSEDIVGRFDKTASTCETHDVPIPYFFK